MSQENHSSSSSHPGADNSRNGNEDYSIPVFSYEKDAPPPAYEPAPTSGASGYGSMNEGLMMSSESNHQSSDSHSSYNSQNDNGYHRSSLPSGYVGPAVSYPSAYQGPYGYNGQYGQLDSQLNYAPLLVPAYRRIMTDEFFDICEDGGLCCAACFFPCCVSGQNLAMIEDNDACCPVGCLFQSCICGCTRTMIQETLGVPVQGTCINFITHCFCKVCALTQEARAIRCWILDGRPAAVAVPPPVTM